MNGLAYLQTKIANQAVFWLELVKILTREMGRDNISIYIDIVNCMKVKCCKNKKSVAELKKTTDFLKIINEENRLKILCLLRKGELCVCEIWECLKIPQNLTSHHLKVLKDFGLISSEKRGLKVFYKLSQKIVKKYFELLKKFLLN